MVEEGVECGLAEELLGLWGEEGARDGLAEGWALGKVEMQADAEGRDRIYLHWLIATRLLEYHILKPFTCLL